MIGVVVKELWCLQGPAKKGAPVKILIPLLYIQLVPKDGLEPSQGCPYWILNPARLPIPPLRLYKSIANLY